MRATMPRSSRSSRARSRPRRRSPGRSRRLRRCAPPGPSRSSSSTARPSTRRPKATSARWRRRCSTSSAATVALVCPAFPDAGRTVYQGHLFVGDRLLSESGMERHPLNPMTDPDLRRWLARQTDAGVGLLALADLRAGRGGEALAGAAARGERLVVADAIANDDLLALGRLADGHALVTGGSGIALGLPANFGIVAGVAAALPATAGDTLVLAGSCSAATRGQIAAYTRRSSVAEARDRSWPRSRTRGRPGRRLRARQPRQGAARLRLRRSGRRGAEPGGARHGSECALLRDHPHPRRHPRRRRGLPPDHRRRRRDLGRRRHRRSRTGPLVIGPEIATGVPAMRSRGTPPLALALKSGNFGGADFFARAAAVLAGERP